MTPEQLATARHNAIEQIRSHVGAWIGLLQTYVDSLPPESLNLINDDDAARSYAEYELRAMKRDLGALIAIDTIPQPEIPKWRSLSCEGETCSICNEPAGAKVEEHIFSDDPIAVRHPLTAYVCMNHFRNIMGSHGYDRVEHYRNQMLSTAG